MIGSWLSNLGIQIPFTPIAVVLAQMFVASPYYIKSATAGLASVSKQLEQHALVDGATPLQAFRLVSVPLAWRSLFGGAALTWARALGEFGATIIFVGNFPGRTQTMPLAVYIGFEIDFEQAVTLAAVMLIFSFVILFTIRTLLQRTAGHRFT